MKSYIRLVYASKTTANPLTIRIDLMNILSASQLYNSKHHIHGVLFYGYDHFFQCLEGEKSTIDVLYQRLLKDPRHEHIVLLHYEPITAPKFSNWQMKYVCHEESIQQFFKSNFLEIPDFEQLEPELIEPFLNLLYIHEDHEPGQYETVERTAMIPHGYMLNHRYATFTLGFTAVVLVFAYFLMVYTDTIMHKISIF